MLPDQTVLQEALGHVAIPALPALTGPPALLALQGLQEQMVSQVLPAQRVIPELPELQVPLVQLGLLVLPGLTVQTV